MLKVKAYESFEVVLSILIAAFFLGSGMIVAIVNAFGDQEPRIYYGAILVSAVGCIFLAIAILVPVCCTTYDTYDENGIVRTKRGKVLLEIKWGEVIEAEYLGWIWILAGAPLSLSLCMRAYAGSDGGRRECNGKIHRAAAEKERCTKNCRVCAFGH